MKYFGLVGSEKYKKEIEDTLINLFGANNICNYDFTNEHVVYFIDENNKISFYIKDNPNLPQLIRFFDYITFIKKYPFKYGDNVVDEDDDCGTILGCTYYSYLDDFMYKVVYESGDSVNYTTEELSYLDTNKSENDMVEASSCNSRNIVSHDPNEIVVDFDKYEIDEEKTTKSITVFKKKIKYPKTFQECYKLVYGDLNVSEITNTLKNPYNINTLYKLLVCRDAYIKQYGGWEPNWHSCTDIKYCIICDNGNVKPCQYISQSKIFAFPTKELRDTFLETFKNDIELIKYLI